MCLAGTPIDRAGDVHIGCLSNERAPFPNTQLTREVNPMGQQQLILLVLATVIVGVAIVVGIRAFTENSAKANSDAMTQAAVRIANDAQAWKKKPAPFGGQASVNAAAAATTNNFTGASFALLGYGANTAGTYTNLDGQFVLTPGTSNLLIDGYNVQEQNHIRVTVTGVTDATIAGAIICLGGRTPAGAACTVTAP